MWNASLNHGLQPALKKLLASHIRTYMQFSRVQFELGIKTVAQSVSYKGVELYRYRVLMYSTKKRDRSGVSLK